MNEVSRFRWRLTAWVYAYHLLIFVLPSVRHPFDAGSIAWVGWSMVLAAAATTWIVLLGLGLYSVPRVPPAVGVFLGPVLVVVLLVAMFLEWTLIALDLDALFGVCVFPGWTFDGYCEFGPA